MQHKSQQYNLKNTERDEAHDLWAAIQPDAITPDSAFLQDLEDKLQQRAAAPKHSFSLTFNVLSFMENHTKVLAVSAMATLTAAVAVGAGAWSFYRAGQTNLNPLPNSEAILEQIIASGAQKPGGTTAGAGKLAAGDSRIASTMLIAPKREGYYFDSAKYTFGPKADVCGNYRAYKLPSYTTEYYEFNGSGDNQTYSKSIIVDSQGKLLDYRLSTPDAEYVYKGGSFAVKVINQPKFNILASDVLRSTAAGSDEAQTLPAPELPVEEPKAPSIKDFFGDNAKVVGEELIDGKMHYVVVWEYENFCSDNEKMQMIYKTWMEKDGFRQNKQEMYAGSIADGNLVSRTEFTYEQSKPSFASVSSKFAYAYSNIETRTVDAKEYVPGSAKYNAAFSKYLAEKGVTLLKPVDAKYAVQLFTSDTLNLPTAEAYLLERSFFRADSIGEQDFNMSKDIFSYKPDYSVLPHYNLAFERGGKSWRNVVAGSYKGLNAEKVLKSLGLEEQESFDVKVTVNGEVIDAKVYRYKQDKQTANCADCVTDWTVVLTRGDELMSIRFTAISKLADLPQMLQFTTLNMEENKTEIDQLIKAAGDKYVGPQIAF